MSEFTGLRSWGLGEPAKPPFAIFPDPASLLMAGDGWQRRGENLLPLGY